MISRVILNLIIVYTLITYLKLVGIASKTIFKFWGKLDDILVGTFSTLITFGLAFIWVGTISDINYRYYFIAYIFLMAFISLVIILKYKPKFKFDSFYVFKMTLVMGVNLLVFLIDPKTMSLSKDYWLYGDVIAQASTFISADISKFLSNISLGYNPTYIFTNFYWFIGSFIGLFEELTWDFDANGDEMFNSTISFMAFGLTTTWVLGVFNYSRQIIKKYWFPVTLILCCIGLGFSNYWSLGLMGSRVSSILVLILFIDFASGKVNWTRTATIAFAWMFYATSSFIYSAFYLILAIMTKTKLKIRDKVLIILPFFFQIFANNGEGRIAFIMLGSMFILTFLFMNHLKKLWSKLSQIFLSNKIAIMCILSITSWVILELIFLIVDTKYINANTRLLISLHLVRVAQAFISSVLLFIISRRNPWFTSWLIAATIYMNPITFLIVNYFDALSTLQVVIHRVSYFAFIDDVDSLNNAFFMLPILAMIVLMPFNLHDTKVPKKLTKVQYYKENPEYKKMHENILKIYKKAMIVFNNKKIKPIAIAGTAIGTMYWGGFIPWDDDMDLVMSIKDYYKLESSRDDLAKQGLKLTTPIDKDARDYVMKITSKDHPGFIDIVIYYPYKRSVINWTTKFLLFLAITKYPTKNKLLRSLSNPLALVIPRKVLWNYILKKSEKTISDKISILTFVDYFWHDWELDKNIFTKLKEQKFESIKILVPVKNEECIKTKYKKLSKYPLVQKPRHKVD